jgi:hypothetical protein
LMFKLREDLAKFIVATREGHHKMLTGKVRLMCGILYFYFHEINLDFHRFLVSILGYRIQCVKKLVKKCMLIWVLFYKSYVILEQFLQNNLLGKRASNA